MTDDDVQALKNIPLLAAVHAIEVTHLRLATDTDNSPKDIPWPEEYKALIKECERRGLCL